MNHEMTRIWALEGGLPNRGGRASGGWRVWGIAVTVVAAALMGGMPAGAAELRIGMIGLDTSHATAFTRLLQDPSAPGYVGGGKVVVAVKASSPDIESSHTRVDGYAQELTEKYGVRLVADIPTLCREVDVVMIESVDGRPHLEQARPVIAAGKRLFIDKPVAGTLKDAVEIYRLARAANVPVFTASAYRYYASMTEMRQARVGTIRSAISYGPAHLEPHHPDFFWYGIHPVEALFTVLGRGCQTVVRTATEHTDTVTGVWNDGRVGHLQGLRGGPTPHKVIVFGSEGVAEQKGSGDYAPLVREIVRFFQTGVAPVSPEETLEIFAFMEAADESKRLGGRPVNVPELLRRHGG